MPSRLCHVCGLPGATMTTKEFPGGYVYPVHRGCRRESEVMRLEWEGRNLSDEIAREAMAKGDR